MILAWRAAGLTDVGRVRAGNEDAFRADAQRGLFLIADGMGGHAAGEVASALAAEVVGDALAAAVDAARGASAESAGWPAPWPELAAEAFARAHQRLIDHCAAHPGTHGMGTTVTACVLTPDGTLRVAHIGDSRLYRLRDGSLEQLTADHTWVEREIGAGRLPVSARVDHPYSHILTRVLSEDTPPEPDVLEHTLSPRDLLLLATDGLTNMLPDPRLAELLSERAVPLRGRVETLIAEANRAGGVDNVTAVVVEVSEE